MWLGFQAHILTLFAHKVDRCKVKLCYEYSNDFIRSRTCCCPRL